MDHDLPVFEEAPLRAVDFAPRVIRPPGQRGPVIAIIWVVGLAVLVGVVGFAGEPTSPSSEPIAQQPPPQPHANDRPLPSTRMGALLVRDVVNLESPALARVGITTPSVSVEGSVLVRAARVEIFLEARGNRVIDHATVDTTDPDGGIRPQRSPAFSATFDLPFPRPHGTMWIAVTAYDERGMPLGGTRRPFRVGPLLEPRLGSDDGTATLSATDPVMI